MASSSAVVMPGRTAAAAASSARRTIRPMTRSFSNCAWLRMDMALLCHGCAVKADYNRSVLPVTGKSVLITGAGRGVGKRLAMGFAQAGARVGLLARSQAELDLAKLEIEQAGGNALRIRADVRDLEQMCAAVDRIRAVFGCLDVLVVAAGVQGPVGPFLTTKAKAWNETIEINL